MSLLQLITGFGLAAGAGGRAMIVALALGVFHYTPYFNLGQDFQWIAAPPVMTVLAVLAALELIADWYPSLGELNDVAGYAPKAVAGFIALAAATGQVSDNLLALASSGLLGAATASGVHWGRTKVRRVTRDLDGIVDRGASAGETAATTSLAGVSFLYPILVPVVLVIVALAGWLLYRSVRKMQGAIGEVANFEDPNDETGADST